MPRRRVLHPVKETDTAKANPETGPLGNQYCFQTVINIKTIVFLVAWTLPVRTRGPQSLKQTFTILIADRNPNVRELLKRELVAEGYRVHLARSGREVLSSISDISGSPDLVIIDPDLPDMGEFSLLDVMRERRPELPVVVHTFLAEYTNPPTAVSSAAVVEKDGRHVDRLKDVVREVLAKSSLSETS